MLPMPHVQPLKRVRSNSRCFQLPLASIRFSIMRLVTARNAPEYFHKLMTARPLMR